MVVALASTFISEHYGGPQFLYALLFGMAFNFLAAEPRTAPGIDLAAKRVLRFGVALLGARITVGQIAENLRLHEEEQNALYPRRTPISCTEIQTMPPEFGSRIMYRYRAHVIIRMYPAPGK